MKIKLHTPLDRILAPVKEILIEHPVSVEDLLRSLTLRNGTVVLKHLAKNIEKG